MTKHRVKILVTIPLLLFLGCQEPVIEPTALCTVPTSTSSHPKATEFQAVIDKYLKAGLPGISVLIRDENGIWVGSGGQADIDKGIPMNPCHISKTASITKTFVAVLALKLVEEEKLQLDEKITKWLPEEITANIENAETTTLRNLLNHTSGIFDFSTNEDFYLSLLNFPNKKWEPEELLEFSYDKEAEFPTGTTSGYSNTNTVLATMVIEAAMGRSHVALLREKIFEPLGLDDSYYYYQEELPANRVAQGYFDLYNCIGPRISRT